MNNVMDRKTMQLAWSWRNGAVVSITAEAIPSAQNSVFHIHGDAICCIGITKLFHIQSQREFCRELPLLFIR